ncbi:MAG: hypothetical protein N3A65_05255 [candidate division WOR-3 bacterium]|nr:hypothetical protein [candidate division WOR-3 bacterium]
MNLFQKLAKIDRRLIYLTLTVLVILPFFVKFRIPQNIMPQTRKLFDFIESLGSRETKAVLISIDYTPQTMPECHPMAISLLTHCFKKKIPVVGLSFDPQAPGLAIEAFNRVVNQINALARTNADSVIYGRDYVYLGWKSGRIAALMEMGEKISNVFPKDYYNNYTDSLPLMRRIKNYRDISIAIILAAADYPQEWLMYAQARYGLKLGAGLTAVMAPKYYPFLQTGQLSGMISGMKGAAEYENLLLNYGYTREIGRAETGMNSQTLIHLLIISLIIIGNIGYIATKKND